MKLLDEEDLETVGERLGDLFGLEALLVQPPMTDFERTAAAGVAGKMPALGESGIDGRFKMAELIDREVASLVVGG